MKTTPTKLRSYLLAVFASCAVGGVVAATIATPTAASQPAPCTAAGLAETVSRVAGDAGNYLNRNPDVNQAVTGAGSETPEQAQTSLRGYFVTHPQQYNDLKGIAQPLTDLRQSCPQNISGAQIAAILGAFAS